VLSGRKRRKRGKQRRPRPKLILAPADVRPQRRFRDRATSCRRTGPTGNMEY
jgi:hypothetical protein